MEAPPQLIHELRGGAAAGVLTGDGLRRRATEIALLAGRGDVEFAIGWCPGYAKVIGPATIALDPGLAEMPPAVLDHAVAHELGHLTAGHPLRRTDDRRYMTRLRLGWGLWLLGVVVAFTLIAARASPSTARVIVNMAPVLAGTAAYIACLCWAQRRSRDLEYEADQQAAALGFPLAAPVAAWWQAREVPERRWSAGLSTHPSWAQRRAVFEHPA